MIFYQNGLFSRKKRVFLITPLLFFLTSCVSLLLNTGDLMVRPDSKSILVLKPAIVYRDDVNGKDTLTVRPDILRWVSDSVIIENYYRSFTERLTLLGFKVYSESSLEKFLGDSSGLIVLNLSQLSLEEYCYNKREKEVFEEATYFQDFVLNAVSLNSWIEFQGVNAVKPYKVLFASNFISDKVEGDFARQAMSGKVVYNYKLKSIQPSAVYTLARQSGSTHADYLYDYLLNLARGTVSHENEDYVRYNRKSRRIEPAAEERFFELK